MIDERYISLIEATGGWIWEVDKNGVYTFCSNKVKDLIGYESDKILGKMPFDLMSPGEGKRVADLFHDIVLSQKPFDSLESIYLHKDGSDVIMETGGVPIFNSEGSFIGYRGIDRDITKRKQAEETLLKVRDELEERARDLIVLKELQEQSLIIRDSLTDAMIYCLKHTPDGCRKYTYASKGCSRLFQVEPEEIAEDASRIYNMIHPEYVEKQQIEEKRSIKQLDDYNCEIPVILPSGETRWHKWYAKPKKMDDGTLVWDGMCLDITSQKEAEVALRNARDEMEVQVQVRTRDLLEANQDLKREIEERRTAELKLKKAYSEIKQLKDQLEADQVYLREEIKLEHNYEDIIGNSEKLEYVLFRVGQIAPSDTTVLILGETGTGKELIARAIHNASSRKERPLIKVDCASLPFNLIESELFGHEKGAFTGAASKRIGRFELADGATIFLDEIGDLPLELQPKLLRVLQEGEFERLGSSKTLRTDVRVIAATNRNLEEDVQNKKFRMDLLYRLSVYTITIPPLRNRTEDIGMLVNSMVRKFARKHGKQIGSIPAGTLAKLENYFWPGNVRELENVIQRAVINTKGKTLQLAEDLTPSRADNKAPNDIPIKTLKEVEREHILAALKKTNWAIQGESGAAALLDINSSTLRGRMRKLGIHRPPYRT